MRRAMIIEEHKKMQAHKQGNELVIGRSGCLARVHDCQCQRPLLCVLPVDRSA